MSREVQHPPSSRHGARNGHAEGSEPIEQVRRLAYRGEDLIVARAAHTETGGRDACLGRHIDLTAGPAHRDHDLDEVEQPLTQPPWFRAGQAAAGDLTAESARAASTLDYLRGVRDQPGVEVRIQEVPLYVSLYRFDNDMLVNPHTHDIGAKDSPVFHYERVGDGGLFGYYEKAFDRVWETAVAPRPLG